MKKVLLALLLMFACISCEYPKPVFTEDMSQETRDSLTCMITTLPSTLVLKSLPIPLTWHACLCRTVITWCMQAIVSW